MPVVIVILVAVAVLYWLLKSSSQGTHALSETEEGLLHLRLGNRAQAERLIALEIQKTPGLSRQRAIERAHASLSRDRR